MSWGLIADVDIEADFLRQPLGAGRFAPWFERRLKYPRVYFGDLWYCPIGSPVSAVPCLGQPVPHSWKQIKGPFLFRWACNVAWMRRESLVAPAAKLDSGHWDLVFAHGDRLATAPAIDLQRLCRHIVRSMNRNTPHPLLRTVKATAWRLQPRGRAEGATNDSTHDVQQEVIRMLRSSLHFSHDEAMQAAAGATSEHDGGVAIERAVTGRAKYSAENGFLSIDGEWARYGAVQVEIIPQAGRVWCASPKPSQSRASL